MKVFFYTNRGNKRGSNEDALMLDGTTVSDVDSANVEQMFIESNDDSYRILEKGNLFVVIDGLGGYKGGNLAAKITAESFREILPSFYASKTKDQVHKAVLDAADLAVEKMKTMTESTPSLYSMGAAFAGVFIKGNSVYAFNCGDCRGYGVKNGILTKLTHDHSYVQTLVDANMLSEDDMRHHYEKNIVTSALQPNGYEDIFFTESHSIIPCQMFFLCSDGVWEEVSKSEIEECFQMRKTSEKCAEDLFRRLLSGECKDNVSFILIKTGEEPVCPDK